MPELPEVETARRQIEKYCVGKKIEKVHMLEQGGHAREGEFDDVVIDEELKDGKAIVGRTLVKTVRKGKHIVWELSGSGKHLVFHFGMTGNFRIKGVKDFVHYKSSNVKYDDDAEQQPKKKQKKDDDEVGGEGEEEILVAEGEKWPPRFTKALLQFSDGISVAFTDPRRLGRLRARTNPYREEPINELAADPMHEMPSEDEFAKLIARAGSREIKTVLLDQTKVVCGIGNYLADECLHQAGIHPCERTNNLNETAISKLRDAILDVCTTACRCLEEKKDFPASWLFHGRWASKKEKEAHRKDHVEEFKVGGRTTLCDTTKQKLSQPMKAKIVKPKKTAKKPAIDEDDDEDEKPKKKESVTLKRKNLQQIDKDLKDEHEKPKKKGSAKTMAVIALGEDKAMKPAKKQGKDATKPQQPKPKRVTKALPRKTKNQ